MNKSVRFLIVFIIVAAMFTLTWRKDPEGILAGDSLTKPASATVVMPSAVSENTDNVENTGSMRNLVLVEFFAGY